MPASNFAEEQFAKAALEKTNLTAPVTQFLALCEKPILKSYTGTTLAVAAEGAELSYEGYARIELKSEALTWEITAGSGEAVATKYVNKAAIAVKLNTGTTGRSIAKYFALCDAVTAGNMWFFGKLTEELNITKTLTKVEFEAKKLEISFE